MIIITEIDSAIGLLRSQILLMHQCWFLTFLNTSKTRQFLNHAKRCHSPASVAFNVEVFKQTNLQKINAKNAVYVSECFSRNKLTYLYYRIR